MKGNGQNKIAPIYEQFEIHWMHAVPGDMVIERSTGMWDRLRCTVLYGEFIEVITTRDKRYLAKDVMIVRY